MTLSVLDPPRDSSQLSCVMEFLWKSRSGLFTCPSMILGWAISETWIWAWVVSLPALHYLNHQGKHFSTALTRPLRPPSIGGRANFLLSCPQIALMAPMSPEPDRLCCPVKARGLLSQVLQPVRGWTSSPALILSRLDHCAFVIRASSPGLSR